MDRDKVRKFVVWAVEAYASSELTALSYHDPTMRETAYEAMEKLKREAPHIADYVLTGLERKEES